MSVKYPAKFTNSNNRRRYPPRRSAQFKKLGGLAHVEVPSIYWENHFSRRRTGAAWRETGGDEPVEKRAYDPTCGRP
jgi:hypothetical protein